MTITEATTARDMDDIRALRQAVFVEEQNVPPELEWDGLDGAARHLIARQDGNPAGTLRWRITGEESEIAKIERVCVLDTYRGTGLGAQLMFAALDAIGAAPDIQRIKLSSQVAAIGFYRNLGFTEEGPEYDDAGIPHVDMWRQRP
ncbi:GNAT family N-acetyltransferase [Mangrovicoccus algicola]|uniref:GNAT family N-acetyltransferase n=1 Tax=Mangrovicoccus algicola TaxID=2771008 RepID=A0A8J6YTK4_9RHOB|nr:GNAT family N-acetyltransferase [Mangrovicoccus algicola]MBE3638988.1 GNAT family N-acetyltransferase [Mangrovicoccus algicola]